MTDSRCPSQSAQLQGRVHPAQIVGDEVDLESKGFDKPDTFTQAFNRASMLNAGRQLHPPLIFRG